MIVRSISAAAIGVTLSFAGPAAASGVDQLKAFLSGAKTGQTTFRQVVSSKAGRVPQESSGTFAFARPGKFRWSYEKPHAQIIVGEGAKLWIYDPDLNQVVVRKLDQAPARRVLSGGRPGAVLTRTDVLTFLSPGEDLGG